MSLRSLIDAFITQAGTDFKNLNNAAVKLTGDQTVAGVKSFSDPLNLLAEYTDTTPSAPSDGSRVFTRARATRRPAFIVPGGWDSEVQSSRHSNKIAAWLATNGSTLSGSDGIQNEGMVTAVTGTAGAVTAASTDFFTSRVRGSIATAATANTGCGLRSNTRNWFLSTRTNDGGFHFVCRFGLHTVQTGTRGFFGLTNTNAALAAGTDPSALLNLFGFGWDAGDTTLQLMNNDGSGTATKINLGANFPVTANPATYFYEVRLSSPPGGGQSVKWSAHRLNDDIIVSDAGTPLVANLPANDLILAANTHYANGATAAAVTMHLQTLYIESKN